MRKAGPPARFRSIIEHDASMRCGRRASEPGLRYRAQPRKGLFPGKPETVEIPGLSPNGLKRLGVIYSNKYASVNCHSFWSGRVKRNFAANPRSACKIGRLSGTLPDFCIAGGCLQNN